MPRHNQEYLNDLIHGAAYEAVRQSPLFESLETNNAVDAKADELADQIKNLVSSWIDQECGTSPLLDHEPLRSLKEVA